MKEEDHKTLFYKTPENAKASSACYSFEPSDFTHYCHDSDSLHYIILTVSATPVLRAVSDKERRGQVITELHGNLKVTAAQLPPLGFSHFRLGWCDWGVVQRAPT